MRASHHTEIADYLSNIIFKAVGIKAVRTTLSSLLLMLLLSAPATATDSDSVKYWLPHCKALLSTGQTDMKGAYRAGQCFGMIKASAFITQAALKGGLPFQVCLPDNTVTTDQLVNVVLGFMEAKPNLASEDFIVVTMLAMASTWPCK